MIYIVVHRSSSKWWERYSWRLSRVSKIRSCKYFRQSPPKFHDPIRFCHFFSVLNSWTSFDELLFFPLPELLFLMNCYFFPYLPIPCVFFGYFFPDLLVPNPRDQNIRSRSNHVHRRNSFRSVGWRATET